MEEKTLKCFECKKDFLKENLISYLPLRAKIPHNYCPKCLEEKKTREQFAEKVCAIFGLKAPGPRIWTERKRLINNYGYTDAIIIDCLDYIYKIEHKKKLAESLCLINPEMVDKMLQFKKKQQVNSEKIIAAMQAETKEIVVPINENNTKKSNRWNPDEWLDD